MEQARLAKKRKVKIKFEREDYIASLRKVLDVIDSKCIVCIVKKCFIISEHDYIANWCTHLDFG